jgi:beta-aspartyl-peptidase (threonine type)
MEHAGESLAEASEAVIHGSLTELGGSGGVIALDRDGRIATPFNTQGMYRGWIDTQGNQVIRIYADGVGR